MALTDFRLFERQGDPPFVGILADDGEIRVIAEIARKAISEYFQPRVLTQAQAVALVERNLPQIGRLIARKYRAGDHGTYTDKGGLTEDDNRHVIIGYDDLCSGECLYDALTLDQIKARIRDGFPGYRTVVEAWDGEARVKFQIRSPQDDMPPLHTEPELLVRLCRSETYLDEILAPIKEKIAKASGSLLA